MVSMSISPSGSTACDNQLPVQIDARYCTGSSRHSRDSGPGSRDTIPFSRRGAGTWASLDTLRISRDRCRHGYGLRGCCPGQTQDGALIATGSVRESGRESEAQKLLAW